jgi:hypothetical protein
MCFGKMRRLTPGGLPPQPNLLLDQTLTIVLETCLDATSVMMQTCYWRARICHEESAMQKLSRPEVACAESSSPVEGAEARLSLCC